MTNNFTIKVMEVQTDNIGRYTINPANDGGYNILPSFYGITDDGIFVVSRDLNNTMDANPAFAALLNSASLGDIYDSKDTRLTGMKQFLAVDTPNGDPYPDAIVKVMVVLWH